jgi:hypothetical protein
MNFVVILLGIIVILLLYYLYTTYFVTSSKLSSYLDLKTSNTAIPYNTLASKNSTRYSYGVWIYVNSWNSNKEKTIIKRSGATTSDPDFKLAIGESTPTLTCTIAKTKTSDPGESSFLITNNFPLQKWTYVIVSVDNSIVDFYLDGKIVKSTKLSYMPKLSTSNIEIGDTTYPDIFLASLNRWPTPIDPQTAWNNYLKGTGISSTSTGTNLKLSVLQDNITQKTFSLY